jgi:hypothetical protein
LYQPRPTFELTTVVERSLLRSFLQTRFTRGGLVALGIAKLDRLAGNVAFIANLLEAGIDFSPPPCPWRTA